MRHYSTTQYNQKHLPIKLSFGKKRLLYVPFGWPNARKVMSFSLCLFISTSKKYMLLTKVANYSLRFQQNYNEKIEFYLISTKKVI